MSYFNVKSLDPRVNRLPSVGQEGVIQPKAPLDQFGTFEVFVQAKDGKPFQHEGAVHAPNLEMAFVLAKETFTRRFLCTSLYVVDTQRVFVSAMTDGTISAYDLISDKQSNGPEQESYEIYHLLKRGKQHVHAGTVEAGNPSDAMAVAKTRWKDKHVFNVWAVRTGDIRFTSPGEKDFWNTLPEKRFRDASDYKGGDKLKQFLDTTEK